MAVAPEVRFWRYVAGSADAERCWTWLGAVSGQYGKLFLRREYGATKVAYAHRFSYEMHVGPIPAGLEIDHLCNNPLCVNPHHLEPVTPEENKRRQGARQVVCINGHDYTPQNTYIDRRGHRRCRACSVEGRKAA